MTENMNLIECTNVHPIYGSFEPGWKVIPDFPNYEVNEFSQVRSKQKNQPVGKLLKLTVNNAIQSLVIINIFPTYPTNGNC